MSHLKQKQHSSDAVVLPHFDFLKLEPVVNLTNSNVRHWEVLSRIIPKTMDEWRLFYGEFVRVARATNGQFPFAFNVDTDHIADEVIFQHVEGIAALDSCVAIEWTERPSSMGVSIDHAAALLKTVRRNTGIEIHLDDVGSGEDPMVRASLVLPDVIKIDGQLFHRARESRQAADLISSHIDCYRASFSEIIVEWIETADDFRLASDLGADFGQGFFFKEKILKVVR